MASVSLEIENAKKFSDLTAITEAADSALLFIHDGNGVKKITAGDLKKDLKELIEGQAAQIEKLTFPGAGAHNGIHRGKNLGTAVTAEQYAAIADGTFDDLYIGDYWVISGTTWRIAGFDYWWNVGDTACTTHHVVVVPDAPLYNARMNSTNTTSGGYTGSAMYTTGLATAKSTISGIFGSHVLSHRKLLVNGVSGSSPSGWAWFDSTVDLMNEVMVYGSVAWGAHDGNGYNVAEGDGQLPLFSLNHNLIHNRANWWLRDVVSASNFAFVSDSGDADLNGASISYGVRPAFAIKC